MSKIVLAGLDSGGLTGGQQAALMNCVLLVGEDRHLQSLAGSRARKMGITPLAGTLAAVRQALKYGDVGVLASGDPLFFGIGRRLLEEFGPGSVEVRPALSNLQEACARFRIPWDDASVVSLHGRDFLHPAGELLRSRKTLVFTDRRHRPNVLAEQVLAYLDLIGAEETAGGCLLHVAENLGTGRERLVSGSLAEITGQDFADLNVLILIRPAAARGGFAFGLLEGEIRHSRGLITKDEVRAVTLHKLALPRRGVFWDLGAGSGSVALEAARLNPGLVVYAVEKREEEMANIKANIRRYGCYNVIPVQGATPEVLAELPDPDRIFVGGSGGQLAEIIAQSGPRLPGGGRLVVNGVIASTVNRAPEIMAGLGLSVELSRIEVRRSGSPGPEGSGQSLNPVTVMTGMKTVVTNNE